jgi:hypothetical protein
LYPARKAARFAAPTPGVSANFFSIQATVGSVGRPYIHETSPSAKRFLLRAASRAVISSIPSVARTVIEVIGTRKSW